MTLACAGRRSRTSYGRAIRALICHSFACANLRVQRLTVPHQSYPHELPAIGGVEEIPVRRADMLARGGARPAAQHPLAAHELAIVFAQRPRQRAEAGITE